MKKFLLACAMLPLIANAQTVKKVLLEDYTGSWCQYCPNGSHTIEQLEAQYPATFIAVASHNTGGRAISYDYFQLNEGKDVASGLGVTGYPNGAVDRKNISGSGIPIGINADGDQWKTAVAARLATPAIASISFANLRKKTDGAYEGDVMVKFSAAPATGVPISVNVYVLESKIEAKIYGAANDTNFQQANFTKWYNGPAGVGSPIWTTTASGGYYHDNTLRAVLGNTWGWTDVVPTNPTVGTEYKKHFTFTIPANAPAGAWKPANMEIVAFVAYNGSATNDQKEVLNAEKVPASAFFPSNVETVAKNIDMLEVYPNPATVNTTLNIPYTIAKSGKVTLNVINAVGQIVATPYVSDEVFGSHTILWRPSQNNLAPGTYLLQLSTAGSVQTKKINIQ